MKDLSCKRLLVWEGNKRNIKYAQKCGQIRNKTSNFSSFQPRLQIPYGLVISEIRKLARKQPEWREWIKNASK